MEPAIALAGEYTAVRGAGVSMRDAHHERVRRRGVAYEARLAAGVTEGDTLDIRPLMNRSKPRV